VSGSFHSREYESFRELLVEARKKAGLSQAQLAAKLSGPQSFVSKFERGEPRLDVIEFKTIAEALNLFELKGGSM
jgi:ribosome-binding protein aMBF1 (putative translation factor)